MPAARDRGRHDLSQVAVQAGRRLWQGLQTVVFPPACAVCREPHPPSSGQGIVCPLCVARLMPLGDPQCPRCGHPFPMFGAWPTDPSGTVPLVCRWCPRLPPYVRAARSAVRMDVGTGASMVYALKYNGWPRVASAMAPLMARLAFPPDVVAERTALVPLPLSSVRQRERGFNQAEALARALAPWWQLPVWSDVLRRHRHTASQVRLTPSQRIGNVSRAFATGPADRDRLAGSHLILVDDVMTTAATLNAAAHALFDGGARIISYVTFGRAPEPGDRADSVFDLDPV